MIEESAEQKEEEREEVPGVAGHDAEEKSEEALDADRQEEV